LPGTKDVEKLACDHSPDLTDGVLKAMIATRTKALAVSLFVVGSVTAGMVIGATQTAAQQAATDPASQAASTPDEPKKSPEAEHVPRKEVAKTKPSPSSTATEKSKGAATKAVPGSADAAPQGLMTRMAMMEGAFGGNAGAGERDLEFRHRLDIAQLAAALPTWEKNPKNEVILKRLEAPIPMPFANETPLDDVLKHIKTAFAKHEHAPIPIYVDPIGLQQAERSLNSTVQIDLEGVPLKTSLRLVLKQLGMAYCVRDGVLIISSVQGVREELAEAARELLGTGNEKVDLRLLAPMGIGPRGMMGGMGGGMGGMGGGMRSVRGTGMM
jgi:hypothetical protein